MSNGGSGEGGHRVVEVRDAGDAHEIVCSCGFTTGAFATGRGVGEAWDEHAEGSR